MSDTIIAGGHFPATDWQGELTALESRAEVDSLEDLQRQRRAKLEEHGRLLALHGNFGLFDDRRKQVLESQKIVARMTLNASGSKVTEGMVDSEAYGSEAYQTILDNAITDKIACLLAQDEIDALNERIKNRETALYVFGQELKLAR